MERIMITIPAELLGDIDSVAKRLGQNRSQFLRRAATNFLNQLKQRDFESLMAAGYIEASRKGSDIVDESRSIQAAATEKVWEWDDE